MPGWEPLIVCGTASTTPCQFGHLVLLANNLITDLVLISTLLAVIAFIVVGFKLLTSGGNESALKESKTMLGKVLKGFIVILIAWVLVYTITNTLVGDDYNFILESPNK